MKGLAARLAVKDKVKAVMARALELDPNYYYGGPDRYFGAFHILAPGGVMEKSKAHFEKSLELAPNFPGTKVLMAELYAKKADDKALFEKLLDEALATPDDAVPGMEPEIRNEKDKAWAQGQAARTVLCLPQCAAAVLTGAA